MSRLTEWMHSSSIIRESKSGQLKNELSVGRESWKEG